MHNNTKIYFPFFSTCLVLSLFSKLFKKNKQFTLPNKTDDRNTVVLDPGDILVTQKFSFIDLDWLFYRQKYSEEFLFNTALNYELVFITDNSLLNKEIYKKIDPYGCASYNIYCNNKRDVTVKNINRPLNKLIILANKKEDYNKQLSDNILELKTQTKGDLSDKASILSRFLNFFPFKTSQPKNTNCGNLLDLTDFLCTVNNSKTKDCRDVLKRFKDLNFFETYEESRKKVFKLRNIFSGLKDYEARKNEVNNKRIQFYANAKPRLNELQAENIEK